MTPSRGIEQFPASSGAPLRAILLHGLNRTPLSMSILAWRLRAAGIQPYIFGYSATFQSWQSCISRLKQFVESSSGDARFIMVGHSLGSVMIRTVVPDLKRPPQHCFLLSPPVKASVFAQKLAPRLIFRWLTGEIGQKLANPKFMQQVPLPTVPTTVYAGIAGPRGDLLPFGDQPNDGILTLEEMRMEGADLIEVKAIHTFIMNSRVVTRHMLSTLNSLPLLPDACL